jgi:excisionase family DNA binding protein
MGEPPRKRERIRAIEASDILGVELRTVQAMAARGELPGAAKVGKLWTFDEKALQGFLPAFRESQERPAKPPVEKRDIVYVVQCDYRVKIGYTANLPSRMHALKTAHHRPLRVLVAFDGDKATEKALHERFAALRVAGEWFALRKPIKEWLRDEHGVWVK